MWGASEKVEKNSLKVLTVINYFDILITMQATQRQTTATQGDREMTARPRTRKPQSIEKQGENLLVRWSDGSTGTLNVKEDAAIIAYIVYRMAQA